MEGSYLVRGQGLHGFSPSEGGEEDQSVCAFFLSCIFLCRPLPATSYYQERNEGRSKFMLHEWPQSLQAPKAAFCDHISFHLFYPVLVILLWVAAVFTGLGLSDYAPKMKKMLPLQQKPVSTLSQRPLILFALRKRGREWYSICAVPFIWTFILTWEYLVFCFFPSHVTFHWFSLNQTSHHHRLLQKKAVHEGALGLE